VLFGDGIRMAHPSDRRGIRDHSYFSFTSTGSILCGRAKTLVRRFGIGFVRLRCLPTRKPLSEKVLAGKPIVIQQLLTGRLNHAKVLFEREHHDPFIDLGVNVRE